MTTICRTPKRPRWSGSTWSGRGGAIDSAFLLPEFASHLPELFGPLEEPSLTRGLLFTRRARVFHAVNLPARNLGAFDLVVLSGVLPRQAPGKNPTEDNKVESSKIAGRQIDRMEDPRATSEEQASRKRRLLKGPKEFREMRGDLRKKKR